jgi:hypothetical protein
MNLDGKTLADWLRDQSIDKLPVRNFNYQLNYAALASNLAPLQREVTPTANRVDGGYLTDHGPDHIRKLISRISDLLSAGEGSISPYEAYLLLCAAQFHDVGNIFGRNRHEEKSWEIMEQNRSTLPPDTVERRLIYEIAKAHGGDRKDKLSDMSRTYDVVSTTVRPQLLAAILKFADELAEDPERAARYSTEHALLEGSEIFHEYALALQNVQIDGPSREVPFQVRHADEQGPSNLQKGIGGECDAGLSARRNFQAHHELSLRTHVLFAIHAIGRRSHSRLGEHRGRKRSRL